MANGIGAALEIPESVFEKIQKAQKAIENLEDLATSKGAKITQTFKQMGDIGVEHFIQKLKQAQETLNSLNLDKLNVSGSGMKDAGTQAEQMANSVVKAANAMDRFGASKMNIAELTAEISKLKAQLTEDGGVKPMSAQQEIVDKLRFYEEELKLQKQGAIDKEKADEKAYQSWLKMKNDELKEHKKAEDEKYRTMESNINKQTRLYEQQFKAAAKFNSQMRKLNYQTYVTSVEGSLRTASKATSYAQREQAIKNLEAAIKKLNTTDANYQNNLTKLSTKHKELIEQQKLVERQYQSISDKQSNLANTSEQLARKFALIFSISAISGYLNKLVQVRGEFELQNTALASILQNKEQADRLFNQITQLAVKSPFTVKELTTYTKSLAAYQFQYEELYDTTKRLADVAAGLGVDMQRLILAVGQVKAAGFLRGTETRQFTEAGFNILGELAKYYSELEGRIVSVGEVQERQFKRMIAFEDVAEVFKRVTNEGGLFYQMQERQAETLAGMMSNLRDKIDLMLNSIGESNQGVIKYVIKTLGLLLENYDMVANVIKAAGAAFVLYKVRLMTTNKELITFALRMNIANASMSKQLSLMKLLQVAFVKLGKSLKDTGKSLVNFVKVNPIITALLLVGSAVASVISHYQQLDEELQEVENTANSHAASLRKLTDGYKAVEKAASDANKSMSEEDVFKGKFSELQKLQEALKDRGYSLPIDLEYVTQENIDEIYKQGADILEFANQWAEEFGKTLTERFNDWELGGLAGENLKSDLMDLSKAYSNIDAGFSSQLDIIQNEIIKVQGDLRDVSLEYVKKLTEGRKEEETAAEWSLRRLDYIRRIYRLNSQLVAEGKVNLTQEDTLNDLLKTSSKAHEARVEAQKELTKVVDDLAEKYGGIEKLQEELGKNPLAVKMEIDKAFEALQMEETAQRWATFFLMQEFKLNVDVTPNITPDKNIYSDFRATIQALDTKGLFKNELKNLRSIEDFVPIIQKVYKEQLDGLERLKGLNTQNLNLEKEIQAERQKMVLGDEQTRVNAEYKLTILQKQKSVIEETLKAERKSLEENKKIAENVAKNLNINLNADKKGKDNTEQIFKQRLDFAKKINSEYEKLLQYYSKEDAARKVLNGRLEEAKALGIDKLFQKAQFDDKGILEFIKQIEGMYKTLSQKMKIDLGDTVGDIETTMEIEAKKSDIERFQEQLDNLFSDYELSVELDKAGLPKDLIKNLFDVDAVSLDEVKNELLSWKDKLQGTEGVEAYNKVLKKISDAEAKDLQERVKKYSQYLVKTMSEVEQIKKDAEKEILNIPVTFTPEQKDEVIKKITEDMRQKIASAQFKEFKGTDLYANAFEDLERVGDLALKTLLRRLEEFKVTAGQNLPVNEFKELINTLKKVREEYEERNPFGTIIKGMIEFAKGEKELEKAKSDLRKVRKGEKILVDIEEDAIGRLTAKYLTEEEAINRVIAAQNKQENARVKVVNAIKNTEENFNSFVGFMNNVISVFNETADAMGFTVDDDIKAGIDGIAKGFSIVAAALSVVVALMTAAEALSISLMATLWPLLAVAAAVGGMIAMINIHDARRQEEIESEERKLKNLQSAYEDLGRTIENALDIDQLSKANDAAIKNLEAQIASYQNMIALEQDKKKSDDDKINEYYDAIAELEKQKTEFQRSVVEGFGGIGEDNYASAAQQFVDAWYDAFLETGNGLDALDENFQEFFDNMVKKQLMLRGANKFLEPFFEEFDKMFGEKSQGGENVTKEEIDALQSQWETTSEGLNEFLTNLAEGLGIVGGSANAELDGLSRGIQSVTEETAEIIAGLLNSMRYFVADSNTQLKNIYAAIRMPSADNPIVSELKAQTEQMRIMNNLWRSLVKATGDGDALKVYMI